MAKLKHFFFKDVFDRTQIPITKPDDDIVVRVKPSGKYTIDYNR